jgi:protein SCO1/2
LNARLRRVSLAVVIGGALVLAACGRGGEDANRPQYAMLNPSGDFALTDQDGKPFRLSAHRDQVVLLFFGYLSCPDICPTTLSKLSRVYKILGPARRAQVLTVFVPIDTRRDTPGKLKEYLSYFNVNSVGLTGNKEQVDKVAAAYAASYRRVETHSALGYLYDHSDLVYLIDTRGKVERLIHSEDTAEDIAREIEKALS